VDILKGWEGFVEKIDKNKNKKFGLNELRRSSI